MSGQQPSSTLGALQEHFKQQQHQQQPVHRAAAQREIQEAHKRQHVYPTGPTINSTSFTHSPGPSQVTEDLNTIPIPDWRYYSRPIASNGAIQLSQHSFQPQSAPHPSYGVSPHNAPLPQPPSYPPPQAVHHAGYNQHNGYPLDQSARYARLYVPTGAGGSDVSTQQSPRVILPRPPPIGQGQLDSSASSWNVQNTPDVQRNTEYQHDMPRSNDNQLGSGIGQAPQSQQPLYTSLQFTPGTPGHHRQHIAIGNTPAESQVITNRDVDSRPVLPSAPEAFDNVDKVNAATVSENDTTLPDPGTDALLERQVALRDGSGSENDSHRKPQRHNSRRSRGRRGGGLSRGGKRGPRPAAEPTGDVKMRINTAVNAYTEGRFEEAIDWVKDAIRINAEIHRAWTLLAACLEETGELKESFLARVFACHLQPKVVEDWISCAELGLELQSQLPDEAEEILDQVSVCYSMALRADAHNRPARHTRAAILMEKGQIRTAARDYMYLLDRCEYDIHAIRPYAEISIALASTGTRDLDKPNRAVSYYRRAISHFQKNGMDEDFAFEWQDVNMFVGLLLQAGKPKEALYELKCLARWLLGRADEDFWDDWQDDDREWDVGDARRKHVEDYQEGNFSPSSYGSGLQVELRAKLVVCRLKLGDLDEAEVHLRHIEPDTSHGQDLLSDDPFIFADVAMALYASDLRSSALRFFEPLLQIPDVLGPPTLLAAGRCYLEMGKKRQAEECFTSAIDMEEENSEASIDARYELAKMYEGAREDREAYILVNEAIKLQQAYDEALDGYDEDSDREYQFGPKPAKKLPGRAPRAPRPIRPKPSKSNTVRREPRRPRPKYFAEIEELEREGRQKANNLSGMWEIVRAARSASQEAGQAASGPSDSFMAAAKELIDDFRSYKAFYSWEKYLANLGINEGETELKISRNPMLLEMKERLSHNLDPHESVQASSWRAAVSYRGVPFGEWLELFLEYAISLAHLDRFQEAYKICESARDAEVFAKSKEDMFLVHTTWAACALRARDEETCVAAARYIMRDRQFETDPFRIFSALCRLCPSPASWYASGPVQKYMMRQIKLMDHALRSGEGEAMEEDEPNTGGVVKTYPSKELDVTLLVLYGHILFVSNSFTYALNYFLRAYSIDPTNQMILLSIGQCYIHYALKRQSENRQYLLVQGFVFLHRYYDLKVASEDPIERQEAHYNMARSYHAVGIPHFAADFYQRTLRDGKELNIDGDDDLSHEAAYNLQQICYASGDMEAVKKLGEKYLTV
ncbi:hypothetical protein GGR57DRAFT_448833 [Xylariaceae sp. FL1272]|nr:hypothetical protein GGR57DRAFT_448833 [Xylariaceae sp. FL1272]